MKKKRGREKLAVMLVGVLALSVFSLSKAEAANAIDTEAEGSVGFAVDTKGFEELSDIEIPVNMYKVASVDVSGNYHAEEGFETLDLESVSYDSAASAEIWEERAKEASELIDENTAVAAAATIIDGTAVLTQMPTGLYLVTAENLNSEHFVYSFQPYLISLPNNYYATTGDDTWIYDLTGENAIGLKPEEKERFGDLNITKTLLNQNITSGEKATFVFQVDVTDRKGAQSSKLVTMTFDQISSKSVTISQLPAGADVKVTEIYSGASYEATTAAEQTTTIIADEIVGVKFSNKHNDIPNGGYGVINHYEKDENDQYQWTKMESN